MSHTVTEVLTIAQRLLIDIEDDSYINDLPTYFNEAQRRFATETHCCQAITNITATANNIPFSGLVSAEASVDEVMYVSRVQLNTGTRYPFLPKAPMTEIRDLLPAATTTPERYSIFAKKIYFDTHPDTVLSLNTTIFYSFVPIQQTGSSVIITPDKWVHALVAYIVYCARTADRDNGAAAWADYEAARNQAVEFYKAQVEGL